MVEVAGSPDALQLFGVTLIGATPQNGHKLLLTIGFVVFVLAVGWMLRALLAFGRRIVSWEKALFWARQAVNLLTALVLLLGVVSIWFDDPGRLATAAGLLSAGLAFALQKVITATAGYFVLLRGRTFNLGDRIVMGGVRGDVVALSFMQTTILEMGQPPPVQSDSPAMWVRSRQYTGRIVTVSNSKVFDEPVYNYTREFPSSGTKSWCRCDTRTIEARSRNCCWIQLRVIPRSSLQGRGRRPQASSGSMGGRSPTSNREYTGVSRITRWN